MRCYECGQDGHVQYDCPNLSRIGADGKPAWCGTCDERTRLLDLGDKMRRCHRCHPLRGKLLPQHARCGDCGTLVYAWDIRSECGSHQPLTSSPVIRR